MTLISFAGLAWLVFICQFHIFSGYIWQFMAISAYFCLLLAISTFYIFFDHMFLALIPPIHSTYHLPLLAINGIIFGLHYARYQESFFSLLYWGESLSTVSTPAILRHFSWTPPTQHCWLSTRKRWIVEKKLRKWCCCFFLFIKNQINQQIMSLQTACSWVRQTVAQARDRERQVRENQC